MGEKKARVMYLFSVELVAESSEISVQCIPRAMSVTIQREDVLTRARVWEEIQVIELVYSPRSGRYLIIHLLLII
jgi:hypothetical protein